MVDLPHPNGITLSHDGREVWVGEFYGNTVRAFPIRPDGTLGPSRAAFTVQVPAGGKGLRDGRNPLPDGRLLVAMALGVQIVSPSTPAILIPSHTAHSANDVRILADPQGQRWMFVAHIESVLKRRTLP